MEQNCRLCLIEDINNSFMEFSNVLVEHFELSIYDFYKIFSAINLNLNECEKSKICFKCHQKLQSICIFRNEVIKNNDIFNNWKKNVFPDFSVPESSIEANIKVELSNDRYLLEDPLVDEVDCTGIPDIKVEVNPEDIFEDQDEEPIDKSLTKRPRQSKASSKKFKVDEATTSVNFDVKSEPEDEKREERTKFDYLLHGKFLPGSEKLTFVKRKITCNYCKETFSSNSFRPHIVRKHLKLKPFACDFNLCDRSFSTTHELKEHKIKHSGIASFHCDECDLKYVMKSALNSHKMFKHPKEERIFACQFPGCAYEFPSKGRLNEHYNRSHLKIRKFSCSICAKEFLKKNKMEQHEYSVHNIGIYKKEDTSERRLKNPVKMVLCPVCGISVRSETLKNHNNRVHLKIKDFVCDICGVAFFLKANLKNHVMRHSSEPKYQCGICQKFFFNVNDRQQHINFAHKTRPLLYCSFPDCNITSDSVSSLNNHIKYKHLKIRKHVCKNCDLSFFTPYELREHMTNYLTESNVVCEACGKKFKSQKKLRIHIHNKHEEPKFSCSTCDRKFREPGRLKVHEKAHQGIKDYKCSFCSKDFTTNQFLLGHVRDLHFISKIHCEICSSKFNRPSTYKNHVKSNHKDIGPENVEALLLKIGKIQPDYDKLEYVLTV